MHLNTKNSKLKAKLLLNWKPAQANNKGVMSLNFPAALLTNLQAKFFTAWSLSRLDSSEWVVQQRSNKIAYQKLMRL